MPVAEEFRGTHKATTVVLRGAVVLALVPLLFLCSVLEGEGQGLVCCSQPS